MHARTGRFRRSDRLLASADYRRVSRTAVRFADREFVLLLARGDALAVQRAPRLGITASRKVGNAVSRNRVKRGVREWFRRDRARMRGGMDVVVIARRGAGDLGGAELEQRLAGLLDRALGDGRLAG